MTKQITQKLDLTFERNGTSFGMVKDIVHFKTDVELPEGFDTGVHIVGAKVGDQICTSDGNSVDVKPTNWVTQVAEIMNDQDMGKMVGKVLTVVDATMVDKEQREAFKALIKQAMWSSYNNIRRRSYEYAKEAPVLFGLSLDD